MAKADAAFFDNASLYSERVVGDRLPILILRIPPSAQRLPFLDAGGFLEPLRLALKSNRLPADRVVMFSVLSGCSVLVSGYPRSIPANPPIPSTISAPLWQ